MPQASMTFSNTVCVKNAELVTPKHVSIGGIIQHETIKDDSMDSTLIGDIRYDKNWLFEKKASAAGSLKKLLGHSGLDNTVATM